MDRGSDQLRERWAEGGFTLDQKVVARLFELAGGPEIEYFVVTGQPADGLHARFAYDSEDGCGNGVREALGLLGRLGIGPHARVTVFPKGLPANQFVLEVEIGRT